MASQAGSQFIAFGAPLLMSQLGRPVIRRVKGDPRNKEDVTAIVDWSEQLGTNQKDGDGVALPNAKGERVRNSCRLTVYASQAINFGEHSFDVFEIDGELVNVIRPAGKDGGLADYICINVNGVSTRGARSGY